MSRGQRPFMKNVVCAPLAGLLARFNKLPHGAKYEVLSQADKNFNSDVAARMKAELTEEGKLREAQSAARMYSGWRTKMERIGFEFNKFDAESFRGLLLSNSATAGIAEKGAAAVSKLKAYAVRLAGELNDYSTTARRLHQSGMRKGSPMDALAYLAFATGNADRLVLAAGIENRSARHKAIVEALRDRSLAKNFEDFVIGGKVQSNEMLAAHVDNWLKDYVTPNMLDDMSLLYKAMGDVRKDYIDDFTRTFMKEEGRAPTREEIYREVGGTFGAFMPRVWANEYKSGFVDDMVAASADGIWENSLRGIRTDDGVIPFPQLLRKVATASRETPLKLAGKVYTSPEDAVKAIWPTLSEAKMREYPNVIRHLVKSGNDALILRAVPSELRDPFYSHRTGQLGFEQSFIESTMAYLSAGLRSKYFNPMLAPGGEIHDFMVLLNTADAPLAKAVANHLDRMIGRNGTIDKDLVGMMHPITRLIANAVFAFNPGPAMMNLTSVVLQGIPYAFTDGFAAGTKDTIAALSMLVNPNFRPAFLHVYDQAHLGGAFAYGYSTTAAKVTDLGARLVSASADGDLRGAFVASKELGMSGGEWLAWTEGSLVRPFAAALGLARYYRTNGLHMADGLQGKLTDGALQMMMDTIDQTTTLQGGINSAPWLQRIRDLPVIGSPASMLTVTPTNIFTQYVRDLRRIVAPGDPSLRAPAARRLAVTAAMGTLVAGPFWFVPLWRDLEKEPDSDSLKETLLSYANSWEKKYSLAGIMNTELAQRLNPVSGIVDRFVPGDNPLMTALFGPLGRPLGDAGKAIMGDQAALRRSLGALSGFADLTPDNIMPESVQYLMPGGVAFEKFAKALAAVSLPPSASGAVNVGGGVQIVVPTLDGNRVDVAGRPFPGGSADNRIRTFFFGGRSVDEAQIAAEGKREQKRADRQDTVEQTLRRQILDGNLSGAAQTWTANSDLPIEITLNELQRESLNRTLLPQARAVMSDSPPEAARKVLDAARRLEAGGLSEDERKNQLHIVLAGMLRFK